MSVQRDLSYPHQRNKDKKFFFPDMFYSHIQPPPPTKTKTSGTPSHAVGQFQGDLGHWF